MSAGKGSKPRPFSVNQKTFNDNWDRIFKKTSLYDNNIDRNNFQDILSTEDCVLDSLKFFDKNTE